MRSWEYSPLHFLSIAFYNLSTKQVPYQVTKPLHHSQQVIQHNDDGSAVMQVEVVLNFEIERDLISYGEGLKVLYPRILVKHISNRLKVAAEQYETNL